jgi:hypothetical protein
MLGRSELGRSAAMDDETNRRLDALAAEVARLALDLLATRAVLTEALAMAPIDLEDLRMRLIGLHARGTTRSPAGAALAPALAAAIEATLDVAAAARRRAGRPPAAGTGRSD